MHMLGISPVRYPFFLLGKRWQVAGGRLRILRFLLLCIERTSDKRSSDIILHSAYLVYCLFGRRDDTFLRPVWCCILFCALWYASKFPPVWLKNKYYSIYASGIFLSVCPSTILYFSRLGGWNNRQHTHTWQDTGTLCPLVRLLLLAVGPGNWGRTVT